MDGQQQRTISVAIRGPILPEDLAGLCDRVCGLLAAGAGALVLCDVAGVGADATAVDALARLQLAARRHGSRVRMCNPTDDLRRLVCFLGFEEVLPG